MFFFTVIMEWMLGKDVVLAVLSLLSESSSVATKLRISSKLRRFLSEDPSSVHFQMPKNLRSFEDLRPKIAKIF